MFETLIVLGIVCVIGAIVGGGLKAVGVEIPAIASVNRQALLGTAGIALVVAALVTHSHGEHGPPSTTSGPTTSSPSQTPTTTSTPTETAPPTPTTTTTATPSVRNSGTLTLTYLYGADLDSLNQDWDVATYDDQSELGKGDVILSNQGLQRPITSSTDLALVTGPASDQTCASATGYTENPLEVSAGQDVCVRTSGHRYAFMHVTSMHGNSNDAESMSVTMTVTVWDPPFE